MELQNLNIAPHIICICEHWFWGNEISTYKLNNYRLISSFSRHRASHCGSAIFVQDNIKSCHKYSKYDYLSEELDYKLCAVTVPIVSTNYIIMAICRSPNSYFNKFYEKIEIILEDISKTSTHVIITTDINVDIPTDSNDTRTIVSRLKSFNLGFLN